MNAYHKIGTIAILMAGCGDDSAKEVCAMLGVPNACTVDMARSCRVNTRIVGQCCGVAKDGTVTLIPVCDDTDGGAS